MTCRGGDHDIYDNDVTGNIYMKLGYEAPGEDYVQIFETEQGQLRQTTINLKMGRRAAGRRRGESRRAYYVVVCVSCLCHRYRTRE